MRYIIERILIAFFLVIICFVLQTTVFQWISFGGIVPNILIILTSTYGFMNGEKGGLIIGFSCGLLYDIIFGSFLGFNAILYMYIGFFNGKFHQVFYPDDIKLPIILFIVSDLLYNISFYMLMFMLRGRFEFSYYLLKVILPEMIYSMLIALVIYPLLLLIHKKLDLQESKKGMKFV